MDRAEYQQLLVDVAGGGPVTGAAASHERDNHEEVVAAAIQENYWGLMMLGDAIHQFYRDTLGEVATSLHTTRPSDKQAMYVHWHVAAFTRYAAALYLLSRGYYSECATLARGLWEIALTLCALQRDIVTISDISGGQGDAGVTARQAANRRIEADRKIQAALLWKNASLSASTMRAVETFVRLLNAATHKSILHLAMNLHVMEEGRGISLFPTFEDRNVTGAANILFLSSWSLISTIRYFGSLLPAEESSWSRRYGKALQAFSEGIATGPGRVVQGFGQVIAEVFVIPNG